MGHYLDPNNRKQTLIEHWDGISWSIVPSPNPSSDSALAGVACASGSECWAVGFQSNGGALQTLIQRWNGTSWSGVPSANKTTQDNRLDGITCDSAGRCWAVGWYSYPTENPSDMLVFKPSALSTLIQRWNGTAWQIVASPNDEVDQARCAPFKCRPLDNTLGSVTCTSASDCWAVGTAGIGQLIVRWNGTSWSIVTPTFRDVNFGELRVQPQSITCPSASDCRVVGAYYADYDSDASPLGFIEQWNGTKRALVQKPDPGKSNALAGVTCASPFRLLGSGLLRSR